MKAIHLEMVRVTEAAAIAAAAQVGRGDKLAADAAATAAMRERLNGVEFAAVIVIGEGRKDGAPGLFAGEVVGGRAGEPTYDIAVDPIEGTTPTARGGYEAMSVLAVGGRGCLYSSDVFYMRKLAVGPAAAGCGVGLGDPVEAVAAKVAQAVGKPVDKLTFCVLDRPRHAGLIGAVRGLGCRIRLIGDCDVSGAIATCVPGSGIDVYMGVGGAPEGVISAAALKCMGGLFQGTLCGPGGEAVDGRVLGIDDLARGDIVFCATGITDGSLLRGVRYPGGRPKTHSVLMRSESGTVRWIEAEHGN